MIFAYHCAYSEPFRRRFWWRDSWRYSLWLLIWAGHHLRVHQNGSPFRDGNVFMFSGEQYGKMMINQGMGCLFFLLICPDALRNSTETDVSQI